MICFYWPDALPGAKPSTSNVQGKCLSQTESGAGDNDNGDCGEVRKLVKNLHEILIFKFYIDNRIYNCKHKIAL